MLKYNRLLITYANPDDLADTVTLSYRLLENSVVPKWIECVELAQQQYTIDEPNRFYGFGSREEQVADALDRINRCINTINSHKPIVERHLTAVDDQDTLNYLHHIFEVYHGLLDCQNTEFWLTCPKDVQLALADLNILVHRCESIYRGARPRHVVTWYGLPKTKVLAAEDYDHFTDRFEQGTVYLNYTEIGKTFEDLAMDDDHYIADEAFRPFQHYSADFKVMFAAIPDRQLADRRAKMTEYYQTHQEFFQQRGLTIDHYLMRPGSPPLAQLETDVSVIKELTTRQYVLSVNFQ